MDRIEFEASARTAERRSGGIRVRINGTDLVELVRNHEFSFAEAEGHPSIAGAYAGLPSSSDICPPSRHFFGEVSNGLYGCDDKTQVLECECGEPGCWPLLFKIAVRENVVVWSDFEQPHRRGQGDYPEWIYDGFGPFTFDRHQYAAALEAITPPRAG